MNIPMVDLKGQYEALKTEISSALGQVLESTQFIMGPQCRALENEIASYCEVGHGVGVASGTDALHLALRAAGIGPGDEVITTAFTFIATAEAIAYLGARPVFVDIEEHTFNIDPAAVEAAVTDKTKAVLPVHLFGQPADMASLADICGRYGLKLIEDCAQSFGAEYGGKKSGAYGDLGCFSFFPSKNLGAFGDGGMVITNDEALAEELRVLRNHGSRQRYHHSVIGFNSRLDDMQAAILRVKLRHIETFNGQRRENARRYSQRLQGAAVVPPIEDGKGRHVYHQYTLLSDRREVLQKALTDAGVGNAIYYPIPLHRQEVFRNEWAGVSLPVAEKTAQKVLSLPMYPELTEEQIDRVCEVVLKAS